MKNASGLQGLFIKHVEKIILGAILLLALLFIYRGYSLDGYSQQPKDLTDVAGRARTNVTSDTWESVKDERTPPSDFPLRAREARKKTEGNRYPYSSPLEPVLVRPMVKRGDPELFAPVQIETTRANLPPGYRVKALPAALLSIKKTIAVLVLYFL